MDRAVSRIVAFCLALLAGALGSISMKSAAASQDGLGRKVMVADVKSAIGVGTQQFIAEGLAEARNRGAEAFILRLDTPGGLVSATRDIIQAILASPVPIVVHVTPSGARAASAGTYITYAAHVAAMSPGTHIGAATPIQIGLPGLPDPSRPSPQDGKDGQSPSGGRTTAERKATNDAVSMLKSLAQLRGRNADWAEKAVLEASTLTAQEAAKNNVVDIIAGDLGDLLRRLDGRVVQTQSGERRLSTANALVQLYEPNWKIRLLGVLTDPNIAFILLMIGVYGIIFEFWSPGLTGPGIVGGISLVVALMALSALPVSYAGLALLALGVALMIAETIAPGFGVLGIGGMIAFALGAVFLFDPKGADIDFSVAWPLVISATLTSALILIGVLGLVLRARRSKIVAGSEEMIGLHGEVMSWSGQKGRVLVHGEMWSARSALDLSPGCKVSVERRDGLTLLVSPIEERT